VLLFPAWYCPWSAYACSQRFQFGRSLVEVFDVCNSEYWWSLFQFPRAEIQANKKYALLQRSDLLMGVPFSTAILQPNF